MKTKILIADDEPAARENLLIRLSQYPEYEVIAQADNGYDVILLAARLKPQVMFLDIKMPGISGLEAAMKVQEVCNAKIIFITAFDEFAIKAFRAQALDYLVKPVSDGLFSETMTRIKKEMATQRLVESVKHPIPEQTYLRRLGVRDGHSITMLNVSQIQSIETAGDYLGIFANNRTHIHKQSLKSLMLVLDPKMFIRIHRTTVINLNFVDQLLHIGKQYKISLRDGREFEVSRRYVSVVKESINRFLRQVDGVVSEEQCVL